MRVNNGENTTPSIGSNGRVLKIRRSIISISAFFGFALFLASAIACGPAQRGEQDPSMAPAQGIPELTNEIVFERINDARVYEVMPESGTGGPITWGFDEDEPKEIVVVDRQIDGTRAAVILDIKTQSSPRANNLRALSGQIRTEWQLETGWVLRRWEIVRTENISMKYKDLPKPTPSPPLP